MNEKNADNVKNVDTLALSAALSRAEHRATGGDGLPLELRPISDRHRGHLTNLVASLRVARVEEACVRSTVRTLIWSYEHELAAALARLEGAHA